MAKKKEITKESKVKLISYTLRATINVGPYENLSPEVTVEAQTIQEAHEVAINHISGLFQKYSVNNKPTDTINDSQVVFSTSESLDVNGQFSDHYHKIHGAINSTNNQELLVVWRGKVVDSKKLTLLEKQHLLELIDNKVK